MREIKFRVWSIYSEKMLKDGYYISLSGDLFQNDCLDYKNKESFKIMQYTGLKDTQGNEIYEGDIIDTYKGNFVVEWDEIGGMFLFHEVKTNDPDGLLVIDYYEFEEAYSYYEFVVVGNVFENPELLK